MAILSVPFILIKGILVDANVHFLPPNLENPMVFAGAFALIAVLVMFAFSNARRPEGGLVLTAIGSALVLWLAALSPSAVAIIVLVVTLLVTTLLMLSRRIPAANLWDRSMLASVTLGGWWTNLWLWWCVLSAILIGLYIRFW